MSGIRRETKETDIRIRVTRGSGSSDVTTDDAFLTHMLETLARYARIELEVQASGDLKHHLIEDVAITLGLALAEQIPGHAARYGWAMVPMDDALARAAIDVGGRPYYVGDLPVPLYDHFFQSFATNLGATLHIDVIRGRDRHHVVEAAVKAVGLAIDQAMTEGDQLFSTKGAITIERFD